MIRNRHTYDRIIKLTLVEPRNPILQGHEDDPVSEGRVWMKIAFGASKYGYRIGDLP